MKECVTPLPPPAGLITFLGNRILCVCVCKFCVYMQKICLKILKVRVEKAQAQYQMNEGEQLAL
jgi:hypothetical protein